MNLANKLTIFRIILVPIMVIIPFFKIQGSILNIPIEFLLIDLIFIIASITDKLDGYLARKNNEVTTFGKFLDPLADKILVLAAMVVGSSLIIASPNINENIWIRGMALIGFFISFMVGILLVIKIVRDQYKNRG